MSQRTQALSSASNAAPIHQLSQHLADSYEHLESRVSELTQQLELVSEQRLSELHEKERLAQRLETLLSVLPGGVIVLDPLGRIKQANPTAFNMLDNPLIGQPWRTVIHRCFAPRVDDGHEVSTHDGRRLSIATRSLEEEGQLILLTDLTETRELQAKLSRNERLSALGKMVSALAHQVRTPLSSAIIYSSHLKNAELELSTRQQFVHKLSGQLHHLDQQVKDMLLFVKGEVTIRDQLSTEALMEHIGLAVENLALQYDIDVSFSIKPSDQYKRWLCNKDVLVNAVVNLFHNSVQATGKGGTVQVRLASVADNRLALSVIDNGPGMTPQAKSRINELFFTTKSQGTGIGLAVVNIVAKAHGGRFSIKSTPSKGTIASLIIQSTGSKEFV